MNSYDDIKNILEGESDRGAVLIAASMIELALENILKAKLLKSPKKQDQLFENNGALGTFSAKIELAYRIGVISQEQKFMFNTFRGIRNEFAHNPLSLTLNDPSIKDRLYAAFDHNPTIKNRFFELLAKEIPNNNHSDEYVTKIKQSPRKMLNIIFVLEINMLELTLCKVERLPEM